MEGDNMRAQWIFFCGLLALLTTAGCSSLNSSATRPNVPKMVDARSDTVKYSSQQFASDMQQYRIAMTNGEFKTGTILRDSMIQRVRLEIDGNYHQFEGKLFENRAYFNTVADWIELALAGAIAAVGGEETKTVLGIVLTGAKGGRLSLDKNFFREKTTETLMSAMQAARAKRLTLITEKMTKGDASQYSWDEAWVDLLDYFYAGTLESGILAIASQTGTDATVAKKEVKDAEKERAKTFSLRAATKEEVFEVRDLTKTLGALVKANDTNTAGRILDELGVKHTPQDNVFDLLRDQIDPLEPGEDGKLGRLRVSTAFRRALNK